MHPVAQIPEMVDADVRQILINREPLGHKHFNAELLGLCDGIVTELARRLGWTLAGAVPNSSNAKAK